MLLVAVAVVVVAGVRHWNTPPAPAGHGSAQDLAGLATPGPICRLRVGDHGFSVDRERKTIRYAAVVNNPCPDVATNAHIVAHPASSTGRRLGSDGVLATGDSSALPALAPGARTAIVGRIAYSPSPDFRLSDVKDVSVRIGYASWVSTTGLAAQGEWGHRMARLFAAKPTAKRVRVLQRERRGHVSVGLTLHTAAPVPDAGPQRVIIVFRDRDGHVIGGEEDPEVALNQPLVTESATPPSTAQTATYAWLPPKTDTSNLQAFWVPPARR